MQFESDSSHAAPLEVVASIHREVCLLLLSELQRLRESGEYDPSVVSNSLKLVKDEGIAATNKAHPLENVYSSMVEELKDMDLDFINNRR